MTTWGGLGKWLDGGGHAVTIKALLSVSNRPQADKQTISVDNKNPDWCGRGYVEADGKVVVGFENGVCLSGYCSEDSKELLWDGGHVWKRQASSEKIHEKREEITTSSEQSNAQKTQSHAQESQSESVDALKKETMLLHIWLDRMFLMVLIFVSAKMCMWCLPAMVVPVATTMVMSLASGGVLAWWFAPLSIDKVLIILVNVVVIAPFNVLMFLLYYPTWPLRQPLYRWIQMVSINLISIPRITVTFWEANFVKYLDILPGGFTALLPPDAPFQNIDVPSQDVVREALRRAPFIKALSAIIKKNVPAGVMNSITARLLSQLVMLPTLGWWWIHKVYVPFLAMPKPPSDGGRAPLPGVTMHMPKCYILDVWRKNYGEEVGRQKCMNE